MVSKKGKRSLVVALSILGVLLIAIGTVAIIRTMSSNKQDPYAQNTSNMTDESTTPDTSSETSETPAQDSTSQPEQSALDPTTVNTIDIVPMAITVSYVKGIGAFEYEVLRANNGTRYVEFSSPKLVGTKCTNDKGIFASIIAAPTESESTALAKTTEVDGTKYGLSLADATCASDTEALQQYQKSFSDAFTLLKKID